MSVVGGANVMFNPDIFIHLSSLGSESLDIICISCALTQNRFLSTDGRSYAFDSRAAGYGRGEGVGILVLKTLKNAVKDGDSIRAVIRETLLNQDGKTQTITSPSQDAQEELMRKCYENVGINPATVPYVEAHGTGTQAGDVVEAASIGKAFGQNRSSQEPVLIGSVKTNIGHLESASGFASVIKVAMALEKGYIPPSINFGSPNQNLDLEKLNLKVSNESFKKAIKF